MYFTLSQIQYIGVAVLGGLILIVVLAVAYWAYKLNLKTLGGESEAVESESGMHEFADGLKEGRRPIPLVIILLIAGLIIWGLGYTLAHAFGVFYAQ